MSDQRFSFRFAAAYRLPALAFGITPFSAWVDVDQTHLAVRYGPWSLRTARENVAGVQRTGDFGFLKTAGPPHLSFTDRGVSFCTNGDDAACVSFHEPVPAIDPTGRILHPGATLTVADVPGLIALLS
jgi:hypothetical protein